MACLRKTRKILDCVKHSEYSALSDENKEFLNLIISCSVVDFSEGSKVKNALWSMFDEESVTRTNLLELENPPPPDPVPGE